MSRPTVFISGTTRGLGSALASEFGRKAWNVVEINRPAFDLATLRTEAIEELFSKHSDGAPAVLVNNAASLFISRVRELTQEDIAREISANITGQIVLIAGFARHFKDGLILNVSSGAAHRGIDGWSLYCASKAAIEGFLRAAAEEGIRCRSIDPGVMDTGMQAAIRASDFSQVDRFIAFDAQGQLMPPEQVAVTIVEQVQNEFLAAPPKA